MIKQSHDEEIISKWDEKLETLNQDETLNDFYHALHLNNEWRENQCINLQAAEGPMSLAARKLLASPLSSRTAAGEIGQGKRIFAGTKYIDEIEALCHAACKRLFSCSFVEHRVLGGTQACQIVQASFLKRGDTILSVSPSNGGDSSNYQGSLIDLIGVEIIDLPFSEDGYHIDIKKLESIFIKRTIKMCTIGLSVCILLKNYKEIIQLCKSYHVLFHADCAHELGLIAGKQFPNPLLLGADVMTGSTGKTLSGPQGGLILWNNINHSHALIGATFPFSVGAYQNNRILALTLTLLEHLAYAQLYLKKTLQHARLLSNILYQNGFPVFGEPPYFSKTHQVLLLITEGAKKTVSALESVNIISSPSIIKIKGNLHECVRFGLVECARLGVRESTIQALAQCIINRLRGNKSTETIKRDVNHLRAPYDKIYYCHEYPFPNHD
jgi:glycine hydroxymethyltransferase